VDCPLVGLWGRSIKWTAAQLLQWIWVMTVQCSAVDPCELSISLSLLAPLAAHGAPLPAPTVDSTRLLPHPRSTLPGHSAHA